MPRNVLVPAAAIARFRERLADDFDVEDIDFLRVVAVGVAAVAGSWDVDSVGWNRLVAIADRAVAEFAYERDVVGVLAV